ncbi:MAG: MBL fold metallo-hydrolase, partial [Patescibacteria group bacterium]|nr:MBL fold metallo-hydrolase [Patescibacteria group bacterium]
SLSEQGIAFEKLEGTSKTKVKDIELEAFDCDHEMIYPIVPLPQNTGYWITDKLFYPGDSLTKPGKSVELLALPVAGPWMTIQQGLDYAKEVKPKQCFPVHDGFVLEESLQLYHGLPQKVLVEAEIEFIPLKAGESLDF